MTITVRDMDDVTGYFVGSCSHLGESDEVNAAAGERLQWLRACHSDGARVKVAFFGPRPVGFANILPIHLSPWGPIGQDLMALPCLYIIPGETGRGAAHALIEAATAETIDQGKLGLATVGSRGDGWFMPEAALIRLGFQPCQQRGVSVAMMLALSPRARPPRLLRPHYDHVPVPGHVTVDLFWNRFCQTSIIEAERVRTVAGAFGSLVVLREYEADDREQFRQHEIARAIFVNGVRFDWGHEAPCDGIKDAIQSAAAAI